MQHAKSKSRLMRKRRVRAKIQGSLKRPRLSVFRSSRSLFVQFIADEKRITLLGESDRSLTSTHKNKLTRAHEFGKELAAKAIKKSLHEVVFDRNGYRYHGRIKALAEGLREGGLKF